MKMVTRFYSVNVLSGHVLCAFQFPEVLCFTQPVCVVLWCKAQVLLV